MTSQLLGKRQGHFVALLIWASTMASIAFGSQVLDEESELFTLKRVIDTDMKLTKSLAVSPISTQFIVGGSEGELKVFNYESAQIIDSWTQNSSQITCIMWQNYHEGLVTISVNSTSNSSLAVQRSSINFKQVHRWQFTEYIYNADSISNRYESFIAFNFMTHVEEYRLKSRKKSTTYKPTENHLFVEISYSSQYTYLYLSGNGQYMYAFKCGSIYKFYYGTNDIITRFQSDKSNSQHSPVIYKKQSYGYEVLDPSYQFNATFPEGKINFFRYCPKDFILGVDVQDRIIIYSRDYKFTQKGVIDTFVGQEFYVLAVACQNDRIIVSASDSKVYVFELKTSEQKQSEGWVYVVAIGGVVTLLLILLSVYVVVKVKKRRSATRLSKRLSSPSLLTSEPKSSVVSEFLS